MKLIRRSDEHTATHCRVGNIVLLGIVLAGAANFDNFPAGAAPPGWTATKTGTGDAKWTVEKDDTAPSKPNVLKQSGQATYPVCIKDDTNRRTASWR